MTKLLRLALLPLLAVAAHAQTPAPDPSRLADIERTDRAFLSGLESQPVAPPTPAPALPPSPPPVAVAPAPQATVPRQTTVPAPATVTPAPRTVEPAAVTVAPAPVAAAPAPQIAPAPKDAAAPRGVTTIELARPAAPVKATPAKPKTKSTVATTRQRSTPERRVTVSRKSADEPIYRGIPVMDPPEVVRVERRPGLFSRPVEVRRPVVIRKVTTTTVTNRERDDDDDRDEDEDDD